MVLIKVDLPQPFGPRMATCSSAPMLRLKSSSATFCPRITRRLRKSSSAGLISPFMHPKCRRPPAINKLSTEYCFSTLKPDAAAHLPSAPSADCDRRAAHGDRGRNVFLCPFAGEECAQNSSCQDWLRYQADRQRLPDIQVRRQTHSFHRPGERCQRV